MVYRALAIGIVLFWLAMTGLLVRGELFPASAAQTAVPPAHVFKQLFLHEQSSELTLFRQRQRLGAFHVQPKREPVDRPGGAAHTLNINGGSTLDFLGLPNQRVILRAVLELDEQQAVCRFEVSATVREPRQKAPSLGIAFDGTPPSNQYHYVIRRGEVVEKEASGTPEQLLDDPALQALGFDPRPILSQALTRASGAARLEARRSTLPVNGETIDTYVVTVFQGSTQAATLQTSRQGQILTVTTLAGYDFYDNTIVP